MAIDSNVEIEQVFGIDKDDRRIMNMLYRQPDLTHSQVAKAIDKSQPAVGARINKLSRMSLISAQYGLNIVKARLFLAVVKMQVSIHESDVMACIDGCPHVVHAFQTTGSHNLVAWLVGTDLDKLEEIVDVHFRSDPRVKHVKMGVMVESLNEDMIIPVDFTIEHHATASCTRECVGVKHGARAFGEAGIKDPREYAPVTGRSTINERLGVDDDDKRIITYLQSNPFMTHTEIGKHIGKSQPAVGSRVAKMKSSGILAMQKGINFKDVESLHLVMLSIHTRNSASTMAKLRSCPNAIGGFRLIGDAPVVALFATHSLAKLDDVIDECIRADADVDLVETSVMVKCIRDFVLPYDFEFEEGKYAGCNGCMQAGECSFNANNEDPEPVNITTRGNPPRHAVQ